MHSHYACILDATIDEANWNFRLRQAIAQIEDEEVADLSENLVVRWAGALLSTHAQVSPHN